VTRWPRRSRAGVSFAEALQVALGCPVDAAGRPLRPLWMTPAEAAEFAARWRSGGRQVELEHPAAVHLWAVLGQVFGS
jgi:hypothetical protein